MTKKAMVLLFLLLGASGARALELKIGVLTGQLLFDVSEFDVEAGDEAKITFHNNGFISHNLIFTTVGGIEKVFQQSMAMGEAGMQTGFVPPILEVLAAVPLLNPNDHQTITFKVPEEPGDYGYICTFPGHGNRMRGVMHVVPKGTKLRPIDRKQDAAMPGLTSLSDTEVDPFPKGSLGRPMVIRTFLPDIGFDEDVVLPNHERGLPAKSYSPNTGKDTGGTVNPIRGLPAAMAVGFGEALSVCWDTVECRMLYAWTGGFLDMTKYWGKGSGGGRKRFGYIPDLMGPVIFHAQTAHPIRVGSVDQMPTPKYLGYRIVNHIPEYMYQLGTSYVQEQITPGRGEASIQLRYFVHGANEPVFFVVDETLKARIDTDAGTWKENVLKIDPATAKQGFELQLAFSEPVELAGSTTSIGGKGITLPSFKSTGGVIGEVKRLSQGKAQDPPVVLMDGLKEGLPIYLDREYAFKNVAGALVGADLVQTFNNDKKGGRVHYELSLTDDAVLFLLVDTRTGPPWLKGSDGEAFKLIKSQLSVGTSDAFSFAVYGINLPKGRYELGPQSDASFYSIAARKGHVKELK